jgi:outer membrane lipoprotein-sorting protein
MMDSNEKKISDYIDRLNKGQKPEIDLTAEDPELIELIQTVNLVHSLKKQNLPSADFEQRLVKTVKENTSPPQKSKRKTWAWITSIASIVAIFFLSLLWTSPFNHDNIVSAMERAFKEVKAYHGMLEIIGTSADGESTTQARLEVWADTEGHYYIKGLDGAYEGIITVNNGKKKWQIRSKEEQVHVFPAFPDPYQFIFELGNEIEFVKKAVKTKEVGKETIAGKETTILEVTPDGADPYRIWVDHETNLPLRKETAMLNAYQYTTTYTDIEFHDAIPSDLLAYDIPSGYETNIENPEQIVSSIDEASQLAGFTPSLPAGLSENYVQDQITYVPGTNEIKILYKSANNKNQIVVIQKEANEELDPASTAVLGKINKQIAEIQSPIETDPGILGGGSIYSRFGNLHSIRWQENGLEIQIVGNADFTHLVAFTEALSQGTLEIPSDELEYTDEPEVEVSYDLETEKATQKNVDAGSSPWKLDPAFVTQVFVSLMISSGEISGGYPISEDDIKIIQNTGTKAIIEVTGEKTPVKRVYLERLIRKDSSGIWTVVGYDPVS